MHEELLEHYQQLKEDKERELDKVRGLILWNESHGWTDTLPELKKRGLELERVLTRLCYAAIAASGDAVYESYIVFIRVMFAESD